MVYGSGFLRIQKKKKLVVVCKMFWTVNTQKAEVNTMAKLAMKACASCSKESTFQCKQVNSKTDVCFFFVFF